MKKIKITQKIYLRNLSKYSVAISQICVVIVISTRPIAWDDYAVEYI